MVDLRPFLATSTTFSPDFFAIAMATIGIPVVLAEGHGGAIAER
jgi:predicted MFS family arabinose efflux permease